MQKELLYFWNGAVKIRKCLFPYPPPPPGNEQVLFFPDGGGNKQLALPDVFVLTIAGK